MVVLKSGIEKKTYSLHLKKVIFFQYDKVKSHIQDVLGSVAANATSTMHKAIKTSHLTDLSSFEISPDDTLHRFPVWKTLN